MQMRIASILVFVDCVPTNNGRGWCAKYKETKPVYSPIFRTKQDAINWARRQILAVGERLAMDRQPRELVAKTAVKSYNSPRFKPDTRRKGGEITTWIHKNPGNAEPLGIYFREQYGFVKC